MIDSYRLLEPGDTRPVCFGVDIGVRDDHAALVGVTWARGLFDLRLIEPSEDSTWLVENWSMRRDGVFPLATSRSKAVEHAENILPDEITVAVQPADVVDVVAAFEWQPALDSRASGAIIDPDAVRAEIIGLRKAGINIEQVVYDPYQFFAEGLKLVEAGINAEEFPQTARRIEADSSLRKRILTGRIRHAGRINRRWYAGEALCDAVERARAKEQKRGIRIQKGRGGAKVDMVVALSMAVWAVEQSAGGGLPEDEGLSISIDASARMLRSDRYGDIRKSRSSDYRTGRSRIR